ncbi:MAG: hypothetical protein R2749_11870 [Acidimicrobiales bacterium]
MMGNLLYLALAVGLSTLGALVLWVVRHRPRSMQHQMDAFSRELKALRPPDAQLHRSEAHLDRVEPTPIRPRTVSGGTPPSRPVPAGSARRQRREQQSADRRRSSSES